jgi:hypothetical protein
MTGIDLPTHRAVRADIAVGDIGCVRRWVPVQERSRSLALVYSGMYTGSVLGLAAAPHLIEVQTCLLLSIYTFQLAQVMRMSCACSWWVWEHSTRHASCQPDLCVQSSLYSILATADLCHCWLLTNLHMLPAVADMAERIPHFWQHWRAVVPAVGVAGYQLAPGGFPLLS